MHECVVAHRGDKADKVDIIVQVCEIEDEATVIRNGRWGMWTSKAIDGKVESVSSGGSS